MAFEGCKCRVVGNLDTYNLEGIVSVSITGQSDIFRTSTGRKFIGPSFNNLNIRAYPWRPGGDMFMGVSCPSKCSVGIQWERKLDCGSGEWVFLPVFWEAVQLDGEPIDGVELVEPVLETSDLDANAASGPSSPFILRVRTDGYGLVYTGLPIPFNTNDLEIFSFEFMDSGSGSNIVIERAYLQNFELNVAPPRPAEVSYTFVYPVQSDNNFVLLAG